MCQKLLFLFTEKRRNNNVPKMLSKFSSYRDTFWELNYGKLSKLAKSTSLNDNGSDGKSFPE